MQYLLSDAELKAIYKKIEPVEKSKDTDEKVPYLLLEVQKKLGLVGY